MRPVRILILMLVIAASSVQATSDNGTTFTYQGDLREDSQPANGTFDMVFSLWDAVSDGNQVGLPQMVSDVQVVDGRFTVLLDFGANAFDNSDRWLEIEVNATMLSPRQPITRTPYSIQTRGIFVDDAGNVGIGTSAPSGKVELVAEAAHDARETILQAGVSDAPGDFLRIDNATGNNDQFISLLWGHHQTDDREVFTTIASTDPSQDTGSRAMMQFDAYLSDGTDFLGPIVNRPLFKWTNANDPVMTIESNGDVGIANRLIVDKIGIGDTNPIYAIDIISSDYNCIRASKTTNGGAAVHAEVTGSGGKGVYGIAYESGFNAGVFGQTTSSSGYGVYSSGDFGGGGAKYFVQPHPTDPSKEIRFVCLEGNESGTYFRGSSQLIDGRAYISVPEEFRLVTEAEGLTVQVTAMGPNAALWIESKGLDQIVVVGNGNVEFDYFVNGVRRGYTDLELVQENHSYVPEVRDVAFGTQYTTGHQQILIENGILNPDLTPNEQTAAKMGWKLRDPVPDEFPTEERALVTRR